MAMNATTNIMFWSNDLRPQDCVRTGVSFAKRIAVAKILENGKTLASYRGTARCRICHRMLGSRDLGRFGFVWPQRAEHYVLKHDVWVPELDVLLERSVGE